MTETMTEIYRGAWVVAYREVLRFVRDRAQVLASLTFPLLFLAIFGAGFSDVVGVMAGGVNLIEFMYPGIIAMAVLTSALSAGMSVVSDREVGFLKEILVAPVGRTGVVLGKAIGATGVALLQTLLLLGVAPFVGVRLGVGIVLELAPIASQQGYQSLLQLLVFPMIFLAGVFFPVDRAPLWMEILSKANPVTYGVDAIRQVFLGSGPAGAGLGVTVVGHIMTIGEEIAVVGALGGILLAGAVWAFGRQE